jgi:hypothetical protein
LMFAPVSCPLCSGARACERASARAHHRSPSTRCIARCGVHVVERLAARPARQEVLVRDGDSLYIAVDDGLRIARGVGAGGRAGGRRGAHVVVVLAVAQGGDEVQCVPREAARATDERAGGPRHGRPRRGGARRSRVGVGARNHDVVVVEDGAELGLQRRHHARLCAASVSSCPLRSPQNCCARGGVQVYTLTEWNAMQTSPETNTTSELLLGL